MEIFSVQIIVTHELPADENLYLRCLSNHLTDAALIERLSNDYDKHHGQQLYADYLHQLTIANTDTKGDPQMVICEGLLNLYGTSSEEIIAKTRKESEAQINALTSSIKELSSQNMYLKELLRKNNISFE